MDMCKGSVKCITKIKQCVAGQKTVARNMYNITFSITYETLFVGK